MKVLFYNWVDDRDPEGRGGGVSVYQHAVLTSLGTAGWADAAFISSGLSYDLMGGAPRWEPLREDGPTRRYELINSGTQSPSHHSFADISQIEHAATRDAFFDFIEKTGPYDVVHFNNLEGLPADVLTLKNRWADTRIVFSLHNYYPVCPQVNLWFKEREICHDFDEGRNCATCLPGPQNGRGQRLSGALAYRFRQIGIKPGGWGYDRGVRGTIRAAGRSVRLIAGLRQAVRPKAASTDVALDLGGHFAARRDRMIQLINAHCDHVLCVSEAVRKLAVHYGISERLAVTDYIGTRAAQVWTESQPRARMPGSDGTLSVGYLGYMRRDKGFFFLLETLEALPDDIAARVRVVIAARRGDGPTMARIDALKSRLAGVTCLDGYTHAQLDTILADIDVGVVPVLWHDNLPQVAIEMHARHIPLITSDLGGAQELSGCSSMIFPTGDQTALTAIFRRLLEGGVDATDYWANAMIPVDLSSHIAALKTFYRAS